MLLKGQTSLAGPSLATDIGFASLPSHLYLASYALGAATLDSASHGFAAMDTGSAIPDPSSLFHPSKTPFQAPYISARAQVLRMWKGRHLPSACGRMQGPRDVRPPSSPNHAHARTRCSVLVPAHGPDLGLVFHSASGHTALRLEPLPNAIAATRLLAANLLAAPKLRPTPASYLPRALQQWRRGGSSFSSSNV